MSQHEPEAGDRDDSPGAPVPTPTTGLPAVDAALSELADLDERPVSQHPEALSTAHEALHESLQAPSRTPDS